MDVTPSVLADVGPATAGVVMGMSASGKIAIEEYKIICIVTKSNNILKIICCISLNITLC